MKGRSATLAQKRYHGLLADLGCIACLKDGINNPTVSIHHIDGRTKPGAHWLVLPLCAGHHQDGTGIPGLIAVHPWKGRFEARYGKQTDLLTECVEILVGCGDILPADALRATGMRQNKTRPLLAQCRVSQLHKLKGVVQ